MPIKLSELKWYGSATMPDDDTVLNIGGAIATSKKVMFTDVNGGVQILSSSAGDTTQTVQLFYRDAGGSLLNETKTLSGTTPVVYTATPERLLKAIKSATTAGDVVLEATTVERTGTAQAGAADTITLDAGASAVDNFYNGMIVRLTGGTGSGQIREIVGYVGATKVATVSRPWGTNPDATSVFRVVKGIYFDLSPAEILEVRRPWYNAAANAPGGGAVDYYEKLFAKNTHGTLTLTSAKVIESADPTAKVTFGLAATVNDTGGNGGGNNRKVAPAGVTFASTDANVPTGQLTATQAIGTWIKLSLLDGDVAIKSTYTPILQGNTT